jgi:hypothetical protein
MSDFNKIVVFKFNESIEYKVPFEYSKISDLVNDLLNERFESDNNNEILEETLPLDETKINPNIFEKIINFMQYYHNQKMTDFNTPINSYNLSDLVQEYYVNFLYGSDCNNITEDQVKELRELIIASNFLGIQPLFKLTLVKMGILVQKNPDIIEKTFPKEQSN